MSHELGRWEPHGLAETVHLFKRYPARWWIAGGHALELHRGRSWRDHGDIDVGVLRSDLPMLYATLAGEWEMHVAAAGVLSGWEGEPLAAAQHQNNIWCRRVGGGPWQIDVLVSDGTSDEWIYRRDDAVRLPWDIAVRRSTDRYPYLAPQVQLLYKSKARRAKDNTDAAEVIPALDAEGRRWLVDMLPSAHPWLSLLA